MSNRKRDVAIIGLGTFGIALARELTRIGDRVLGIDIDSKQVNALSDELHSTLEADATDPKSLLQCGLTDYDAVVVSIGEATQASILAALNVLDLDCGQVWVKAQDESHRKILKAIGVYNIILPEQSFGIQLAQIIHNPYLVNHMIIGDGTYIAELKLPHTLAGRTIKSLKLETKHNLKCLAHIRDSNLENTDLCSQSLETGDTLLLHGRRPALRKFVDGI